jgi:hypothetical protein
MPMGELRKNEETLFPAFLADKDSLLPFKPLSNQLSQIIPADFIDAFHTASRPEITVTNHLTLYYPMGNNLLWT